MSDSLDESGLWALLDVLTEMVSEEDSEKFAAIMEARVRHPEHATLEQKIREENNTTLALWA